MSFQDFVNHARAYGSKIKLWPANAVKSSQQHAETPEGQTILAEEAQLDRMLDGYQPDAALSPAFIARIHAIAMQAPAAISAEWQRHYVRYSALSFVTCAVLGLVIGVQLSGSPYFTSLAPHDLSEIFTGAANSGGGVL